MDQEQLMQLVQIYSQMVGADPNQLMQELSQMDEQQLGQAVQQMMSTVQQSQGGGQEQPQPQEGMAPYNAQEYMGGGQEQPQPEMRRGGYYRQYLQDGSTVGKPNRTIQMVTMADGSTGQYDPTIHSDLTPVEYNVYGEGNNTRMVPVSALVSNTNAATNPYMTGTYNQAEYTSEGQNAIKDEQGARGFAAPVNASDISKDELKRIQQVLVDAGYDIGKYGAKKNGVDGLMGKKTAEALRRFEYEDPTAYAQFINLNTSNLPKASSRNSGTSSTKSNSEFVEKYNREKYVSKTPANNISTTQTPTTASTTTPTAKTAASTTTAKPNTPVAKSNTQSNANSTGNKIVKFRNNSYNIDKNIINYNGQNYTPYQFKTMVEKMDNSPMQYTGGAPADMLTLLNMALYKNNKNLFKSRSGDFGKWKEVLSNGSNYYSN